MNDLWTTENGQKALDVAQLDKAASGDAEATIQNLEHMVALVQAGSIPEFIEDGYFCHVCLAYLRKHWDEVHIFGSFLHTKSSDITFLGRGIEFDHVVYEENLIDAVIETNRLLQEAA